MSVKSFNVGGKSSRNSTLASLRGVAKGCAVVVVVLSVVVDVPVVAGVVPVAVPEVFGCYERHISKYGNLLL